MSESFSLSAGSTANPGYTVKSIAGCRLVFGPVPSRDFAMLTHGFSENALMDIDIADRTGATFVIGEPDDLERLRCMDLPVSEKRQADYLLALKLDLPKVATWLRTGERGMSSNAMCKRFFRVPADAGTDHPYDPSDLRRCMLFLDQTESHDRIGLMRDVSPAWASLVDQWDEIAGIFLEESRSGNEAPQTYALMQKIFKEADRHE